MKHLIEDCIARAVSNVAREAGIDRSGMPAILVERSRDPKHGDFTCNFAMAIASILKQSPREIARHIVQNIPATTEIERVEIAGPGFINLFLTDASRLQVIAEILRVGENYGRSGMGDSLKVLVEFVSANPTGPLHIGHGRGAAYGATLANLLATAGFDVTREYYVNDGGRQMDILTLSVWLRYLEQCGLQIDFPQQAYRGEYVREIARQLHDDIGTGCVVEPGPVFAGLPAEDDAEERLDELVSRAKTSLGEDRFERVFRAGLDVILDDIRDDLAEFGVTYDNWYSERSLSERELVEACVERLRAGGDLYEQDGAVWFRSSHYGDEKDRVVIRDNGQITYFASDIAYHLDKFERGFAHAINVWGADHHGYIARVKAALAALGIEPERLEILLVQFATLYRGRQRVQMSTRSGEFVTLRELRDEVGTDAARFFYASRRSEQHLDFDLELAKSESSDNPVYYIQYAHARICSVLKQAAERHIGFDREHALANLASLGDRHESALLVTLSRYPEIIEDAARTREPHQVGFYLRELANEFHAYYNSQQILVDDAKVRDPRIALILCIRQVIANGLAILGVSAPQSM